MIKNTLIKSRIEKLRLELRELGAERVRLQTALRDLGLTENQKKKPYNLDPEIVSRRESLKVKIDQLLAKQQKLNNQFRELHRKEDAEENIVIMGILREIFSEQQIMEINTETTRRLNGERPYPLGIDFKELTRYKDGYHKYRTLSREQLEKMMEFRIKLTGLIESGCDQFGEAEFLKFISPLNRMILPTKELQKIKIKFLL